MVTAKKTGGRNALTLKVKAGETDAHTNQKGVEVMSKESRGPQGQQMQINTGDDMSRGRYSNNVMVTHTAEEFIIEWLFNSPNGIHLVSRIIVSPGHMKRIVEAFRENLHKYEEKFGAVASSGPPEQKFH